METRILSYSYMTRYLLLLVIILCFGLFSTRSEASAGQGPLDGKIFVIETVEKGGGAGEKDTLIFKDGNFHSVGCDQYGFGDGVYTSKVNGDTITFEAVTSSPTKGKMTWKGTVQGDRIEVGYVWVDKTHWYKPNPKPVEKLARGQIKK